MQPHAPSPVANPPSAEPRLRLSSWIIIAVASAVLVTTLVLVAVIDAFARNYARQEAGERLKQLAWQMRDSLNRGLAERLVDLRVLSQLDQISGARHPTEVRRIFNELQQAFPHYAWIGLAETDGTVFAASQGMLEGKNVGGRDWFRQGSKAPFTGDYHPAVLLQNKLPDVGEPWRFVDLALPARRSDGSIRGVLGVHLSWSWARELGAQLLGPTKNDFAAEVLIVRSDSQVLLGPKNLLEKPLRVDSVRLALQGKSGATLEDWPDGQRYFTGYVRQRLDQAGPTLGWVILVRQPEPVALAAFVELRRQILLIAVAVGLALLLASALVVRRLALPLKTLTKAITGGKLRDPQFVIPATDAYKEAYVLSRTLAELIDNERQQRAELLRLNDTLEHKVAERIDELQTLANDLGNSLVAQQHIQRTLQQSEAELKAILTNAHEAFIAIDHSGCLVEWNAQAEVLFGWSRDEVLGRRLEETIIPPEHRDAHRRGLEHYLRTGEGSVINQRLELTAQKRDGSIIPVEFSIGHVAREQGHLFIAFMQDISARKALQQLLESQALEDTLTGLPNRRSFLRTLPEAMARARRNGQPLAVMFLDLDGFKGVNDTHGHDNGDLVLREFARRIAGQLRVTDTVARLAGDEFTVILEGLQNGGSDAEQVGRKILAAAREPFALTDCDVTLSSSIGIALHQPRDDGSADMLLRRADEAMYIAKHSGKNQLHLAAAPQETTP